MMNEHSSPSREKALTRKGFSLIELLVSISVIAILAVIVFMLWPSLRMRAESSVTSSNLRQLVTLMNLYAQDNDGTYPPHTRGSNSENTRLAILYEQGYIEDPEIMINPTNEGQVKAIGRYYPFNKYNCYFISRSVLSSKWGRPWADVPTPNSIYDTPSIPIIWDQRCDVRQGSTYCKVKTPDGRYGGHFGYLDGSVELLAYPDTIIRQ